MSAQTLSGVGGTPPGFEGSSLAHKGMDFVSTHDWLLEFVTSAIFFSKGN